jgi:hypothetical protein
MPYSKLPAITGKQLIRLRSTPIADGTLSAILGTQQSCIGKKGLLDLVNKYGL